jgi:hypothetical protein
LPAEIKAKHNHDVFLKKWNIDVEDFRKKIGIKEKYETIKDGVI